MEQTEKSGNKLENFNKSLKNFSDSLEINLDNLSAIEADTIKNGQIQKFEICIELLWKALQFYLTDKHGVESLSPKKTAKELFNLKIIDENKYENLIQMINDRNRLSHIYNEIFFEEIYTKLPIYYSEMKFISEKIKSWMSIVSHPEFIFS